jgi:hypothetical protein
MIQPGGAWNPVCPDRAAFRFSGGAPGGHLRRPNPAPPPPATSFRC